MEVESYRATEATIQKQAQEADGQRQE